MANTQSSKDKLRSHSAPKQRPEVNNSVYMVNRKNELSKRKRKCLSNSTNSVMNHQRCLGQNADDVSAVLSLWDCFGALIETAYDTSLSSIKLIL
jgi:hypothetical protein